MPATTHGKWKSTEWNSWDHMRRRCNNPNDPKYKYYGGRGIKVCERWISFENFFFDMGEKPTPSHSLDRKDVNGNYEPSNCQWSTPKEQSNNKTNNVFVSIRGEVKSLGAWAVSEKISRCVMCRRYKRGLRGLDLIDRTNLRKPR